MATTADAAAVRRAVRLATRRAVRSAPRGSGSSSPAPLLGHALTAVCAPATVKER
ncbi:hypothetical protein ACFWXK_19085 [Streptomyces sp. NPDC059070]|uniref:hypothetical protein n=1 Tax=unclassified Streptomyces TaxID=2593676 RepID=UPI0034E1AD4D